jgi:ADP-ribose pyrophosphatase YjhB (NUDIX family)
MAVTVRKAARAIILTPANEILLMRMAFPWRTDDLWITPGGGIEAGEAATDAVTREVFEETGATDIQIIGEAWFRDEIVEATQTHMKQRYFLIHTAKFDPEATELLGKEKEWFREYRWWQASALKNAAIEVEPSKIARGLEKLIRNGLPERPIAIDSI